METKNILNNNISVGKTYNQHIQICTRASILGRMCINNIAKNHSLIIY